MLLIQDQNFHQMHLILLVSPDDEMGWNTTHSLSPDELLQILQPSNSHSLDVIRTDSSENIGSSSFLRTHSGESLSGAIIRSHSENGKS